MCLGIPGQIIEISDTRNKLAIVDVSGVRREVNVMCILDEEPIEQLLGVWALIHVGFAMSRIDEAEAAKTIEILLMLGEAQAEIEAMRASNAMLAEST